MFRAVPLLIIRSPLTVHLALVYVIQVCRQLSSSIPTLLVSCLQNVWHIPVASVQLMDSWLWAEELPETRRVSCRSRCGKLVDLVGFFIKKFKILFKLCVKIKKKIFSFISQCYQILILRTQSRIITCHWIFNCRVCNIKRWWWSRWWNSGTSLEGLE